nr:MAG TPA: Nucleoside H+ symporter [Caudoviricetes sp.]
MNNRQKNWLLIGPVVFSFALAMTTPVVHIYFMRLIDASVLAIANMISVGIAAMTNTSVTKKGFLEWYDNHFTLIVVTDVLLFTVISFAGMEWATIRFIGMAIINAISTTLWICVMQNAINSVVKGKELTIWQSLASSYELYASLAGGLVILILGSIDVEIAIMIQCIANLVMGLADLRARKLLMRSDDSDN